MISTRWNKMYVVPLACILNVDNMVFLGSMCEFESNTFFLVNFYNVLYKYFAAHYM